MSRRSLTPEIRDVLEFSEGKEVTVSYEDTFIAVVKGRDTTVHNVIQDGEPKSIWGSKGLNGAFERAERGQKLYITFVGTVDTGKGNPFKKYKIEVDE